MIIAIGIKNIKIPDLIRKELPIQYNPKRNHPKLKAHPKTKVSSNFFVLKIKKWNKKNK